MSDSKNKIGIGIKTPWKIYTFHAMETDFELLQLFDFFNNSNTAVKWPNFWKSSNHETEMSFQKILLSISLSSSKIPEGILSLKGIFDGVFFKIL